MIVSLELIQQFDAAYYANMMNMQPLTGVQNQNPKKVANVAMPACEAMTTQELYKYKTTVCTTYAEGKTCQRFNACNFAHGEAEKRRNPVSPYSVDYLGFNQPIEGTKKKLIEESWRDLLFN